MGRSRYAGCPVVDGRHYETWTDPTAGNPLGPDLIDGIESVEHVLIAGERLDTMAHRYYGDEDYWWVIALANRIQDPFSLSPGMKLRVPLDARSVLNRVGR